MTTRPANANALQNVVHPPQTADLPADVLETAARLGVSEYLPRVLQFTRELFGVSPDVCVEEDPEIPDDAYIVIDVTVAGSVAEIVEKDTEWHRRLLAVVDRSPRTFRLLFDIR